MLSFLLWKVLYRNNKLADIKRTKGRRLIGRINFSHWFSNTSVLQWPVWIEIIFTTVFLTHTYLMDAFYGVVQLMPNLTGFVNSKNGLYKRSLFWIWRSHIAAFQRLKNLKVRWYSQSSKITLYAWLWNESTTNRLKLALSKSWKCAQSADSSLFTKGLYSQKFNTTTYGLSSLRYTGTKALNALKNDPLFKNVTNKKHLKRIFSNKTFDSY